MHCKRTIITIKVANNVGLPHIAQTWSVLKIIYRTFAAASNYDQKLSPLDTVHVRNDIISDEDGKYKIRIFIVNQF